mmetsp:Transcript_9209/g.24169  ORF Transcript_9209/g.24169 Transcript_9209/m.24169 type:complete len:248 (+) Transcript_9209:391-1134(+)
MHLPRSSSPPGNSADSRNALELSHMRKMFTPMRAGNPPTDAAFGQHTAFPTKVMHQISTSLRTAIPRPPARKVWSCEASPLLTCPSGNHAQCPPLLRWSSKLIITLASASLSTSKFVEFSPASLNGTARWPIVVATRPTIGNLRTWFETIILNLPANRSGCTESERMVSKKDAWFAKTQTDLPDLPRSLRSSARPCLSIRTQKQTIKAKRQHMHVRTIVALANESRRFSCPALEPHRTYKWPNRDKK